MSVVVVDLPSVPVMPTACPFMKRNASSISEITGEVARPPRIDPGDRQEGSIAGRSLLLLDDNQSVLDARSQVLIDRGANVLCFSRAVAAVAFQRRQQDDEFRRALRCLLLRPLMAPQHPGFAAVRRQAERLREWFAREAGWPLHVDREGARLFKRPGNLLDATRGLPDYDRRRYVLLCLACAVLERADPQITLQLLGERIMQEAADPALAALGYAFTLRSASERRELVAVCRTLLEQGVLERVAGDEESFVHDLSLIHISEPTRPY